MLEPTQWPDHSAPLRVEPSKQSHLLGRAFLSACRPYPVLPVPAVSCPCRVCGQSLSSARSFARFLALQPTKLLRSPSLLCLSLGLSPSLPTSHARLTSAQPAAASPAQPSHWKPSLLSQLISQLSQLDAKTQPSSRQPSSPSSLRLLPQPDRRSRGQVSRSRSRSIPSTPRP